MSAADCFPASAPQGCRRGAHSGAIRDPSVKSRVPAPKPSKAKPKKPERPAPKIDSRGYVVTAETEIASLKQREAVLRLSDSGASRLQIADRLGVTTKTVDNVLNAALQEWRDKSADAADSFVAKAHRVFDSLMLTWLPRATGAVYENADGMKTEIKPDVKAANVVIRLHEKLGHILGVGKTRVEVTGKDGGPIVTRPEQISDLTDEQLERAKLAAREGGEEGIAVYLARLGAGDASPPGTSGANRVPRQTH